MTDCGVSARRSTFPLIDAPKPGAVLDIGYLEPASQRHHRPADEDHPFVVVTRRRFRAAHADRQAREGRGGPICRIGLHGVVVGQILATQRRHFRPPAAAGGERRQKQCPIAQIDGLFSRAGLQKLCQHIARHRLFALSLPRSGAGADRKPQRRFERRPIEGACQASPTGQDQPVAAPDGLGGMRTFCPKQAARPPPACHGLDLPCVGRGPTEMMGDEFS